MLEATHVKYILEEDFRKTRSKFHKQEVEWKIIKYFLKFINDVIIRCSRMDYFNDDVIG